MGRGSLESTYNCGGGSIRYFHTECERKHLKEVQVVIQLALLRSPVEAHPTRIQQDTDEPDPEKIVGHINWAELPRKGATVSCKPILNNTTKQI